MKQPKLKHYYYFCKECKGLIPRDYFKLFERSYCEETGKNTIIFLTSLFKK